MKTLEEAIGCWTVDHNGLPGKVRLVLSSVDRCKKATRKGNYANLVGEFHWLKERLKTLNEIVEFTGKRLDEIRSDDEVKL